MISWDKLKNKSDGYILRKVLQDGNPTLAKRALVEFNRRGAKRDKKPDSRVETVYYDDSLDGSGREMESIPVIEEDKALADVAEGLGTPGCPASRFGIGITDMNYKWNVGLIVVDVDTWLVGYKKIELRSTPNAGKTRGFIPGQLVPMSAVRHG